MPPSRLHRVQAEIYTEQIACGGVLIVVIDEIAELCLTHQQHAINVCPAFVKLGGHVSLSVSDFQQAELCGSVQFTTPIRSTGNVALDAMVDANIRRCTCITSQCYFCHHGCASTVIPINGFDA